MVATIANNHSIKRPIRERIAACLAIVIGAFVFYTSFFGVFESLVQRAIFVALITTLAVLLYPLFKDSRLRPLGIFIDALIIIISVAASIYIIAHFHRIMDDLPQAQAFEIVLCFACLLAILELSRRVASLVFSLIVLLAVTYALLGNMIPGQFGHTGFDTAYLTEVLFLSDRGLWGNLVDIASTTLAVFVLFGALLLHTGAGQTFFDFSARFGGAKPGGAAKIATISSGFFGAINGSTVANVATTGNFTIPLMKRLHYPASYAAAVEAIASTGCQLAPPIMGTAAFIMAEVIGMQYWLIALAGIIPAFLFYLGLYTTVHLVTSAQNMQPVPPDELPREERRQSLLRLSPMLATMVGITFGIINGNSLETTACYGMLSMLIAVAMARFGYGESLSEIGHIIIRAFEEGGRGVLIVGVLLVGAQVFVAMMNLTGFGIAITNAVLNIAQGDTVMIAVLMAVVCLIAGMGLPTSAAYVLVSAVFAPVLIKQGFEPLTVHLFVLYYAALSVITPPVCLGVFVAAAIAKAPWFKVAIETMRLGASAYAIPMLFLIFPGMLGQGGLEAIIIALISGCTFTLAIALMFGGKVIFFNGLSLIFWPAPAVLALGSDWLTTLAAALLLLGLILLAQRFALITGTD